MIQLTLQIAGSYAAAAFVVGTGMALIVKPANRSTWLHLIRLSVIWPATVARIAHGFFREDGR